MNSNVFDKGIQHQMSLSMDILLRKGVEYSNEEDRLHNFRTAAKLQGVQMRQALAGMMAKHSISLYDMLSTRAEFPISVWEEKIADHINYLLILRVILEEEGAIND